MAGLPLCASGQTGSADSALAGRTLRPGDEVRITVWRRPEYSGEFVVGPDGGLMHPLYREVHVAGEPFPVVEERVRTFLSKFETNAQVVVEPLVRVFVGGEVRSPALVAVPAQTTISEAVALAGPLEQANLEHVRVVRGGRELTADVRRPASGVAHERVESGDQLFVPRAHAIFTEYVIPGASLLNVLMTALVYFKR